MPSKFRSRRRFDEVSTTCGCDAQADAAAVDRIDAGKRTDGIGIGFL